MKKFVLACLFLIGMIGTSLGFSIPEPTKSPVISFEYFSISPELRVLEVVEEGQSSKFHLFIYQSCDYRGDVDRNLFGLEIPKKLRFLYAIQYSREKNSHGYKYNHDNRFLLTNNQRK